MSRTVVRRVYLFNDESTFEAPIGGGQYKTTPADTGGALKYIASLPKDPSVVPSVYFPLDGGEAHAVLIVKVSTPDYVAGLFGKKRLDGLPLVENSGLIYPLRVGKTEGLLECSHFVYFREERQLLLEMNAYAPRRKTLQDYIEKKIYGNVHHPIDEVRFTPAIDKSSIAQFRLVSDKVVEAEVVFHADSVVDSQKSAGSALPLMEALKPALNAFPTTARVGISLQSKLYDRKNTIENLGQYLIDLVESQPENLASVVAYSRINTGKKLRYNLLSEDFGHPIVVPLDGRVVNSRLMWGQMLALYNTLRGEEIVDEQVPEDEVEPDAPEEAVEA